MMPMPVLDSHDKHSPPVLALAQQRRRLATPDCCAITSKKRTIPSLKTPVAQSRFNLRSAYLAKRVSLPLRAITAAPELVAKSP
jgi:hypothetical protein